MIIIFFSPKKEVEKVKAENGSTQKKAKQPTPGNSLANKLASHADNLLCIRETWISDNQNDS